MSAPLDPRRRHAVRLVHAPRSRTPGERRAKAMAFVALAAFCLWFWWVLLRVAEAWAAGRFPN